MPLQHSRSVSGFNFAEFNCHGGKNQPRGNAWAHQMTKAILVHRGLRRAAVAALAVVALAGTQAQTNAPFINLTKPTAEQMALAARGGSIPDRCSTLASQCRLRK